MTNSTTDDEKWNTTFQNITEMKWNEMYSTAVDIWNSLENIQKDEKNSNQGESQLCPMHPYMFFQLSSVRGFNNLNGYTYTEYVSKWNERRT